MRFWPRKDIDAQALKAALRTVKNVQAAETEPVSRAAYVVWRATCRDLNQLELAAASAGAPAYVVNHVHMSATLKALDGSDLDKFGRDLQLLPGVKGVIQVGTSTAFHADLRRLDAELLATVARAHKFEIKLQSHQRVVVKLQEGDTDRLRADLEQLRGVLLAEGGEKRVSCWVLKNVTDESIRKVAEEAGAKLASLDRW